MKTLTKIIIAVLILLVLFVPIPQSGWKDGGTKTYSALTYRIVDYRNNLLVAQKDKKVHIQFFPRNFGAWPSVEMSP